MLENETIEAQKALDELFSEHLIPFKLSAHKLEPTGIEKCKVRFHDSRLHSVNVSWLKGQRFQDVFRAAVLDRVKGLGCPVLGKKVQARG